MTRSCDVHPDNRRSAPISGRCVSWNSWNSCGRSCELFLLWVHSCGGAGAHLLTETSEITVKGNTSRCAFTPPCTMCSEWNILHLTWMLFFNACRILSCSCSIVLLADTHTSVMLKSACVSPLICWSGSFLGSAPVPLVSILFLSCAIKIPSYFRVCMHIFRRNLSSNAPTLTDPQPIKLWLLWST